MSKRKAENYRETMCPYPKRYDSGQCGWPTCRCPDGIVETSFQAHMERCMQDVIAPMRSDAKVTIIVRAPEALPSEAMISTNDSLEVAHEALAFVLESRK